METLIAFIEDKLNIPCIDENETVLDGSFLLVPYMSSGLMGNGLVQSDTLEVSVELFYSDKIEAVNNASTLWKTLLQNKYGCSSPSYTYEQNGSLWRASINVEIIGGNEDE